MKGRESGMPEVEVWGRFFDPEYTLKALGLEEGAGDVLDFGCGYGTFAIPAARRISGTLHGLDIDPAMIRRCEALAHSAGLHNVRFEERDFIAAGSGLDADCVAFAMLFNILHTEDPVALLCEAWRVLAPGGRVGITHWNHDPSTPRGPSMAIRPTPADCQGWLEEAGFRAELGPIELPPYHYGLVGRKA